ncbi:MAG TPA: MerR family transcriptional regulator [Thermoanaerobaculia bacterium]
MGAATQLYRPAEACKAAEVAPYVLRYWESEFPILTEGKDKGVTRLYSERDVRIIARIRELLYDEGFTVAGAKKRLETEIAQGRFEEGLATAPAVEEQKKPRKTPPPRGVTAAPAPSPEEMFPEERPIVPEKPIPAAARASSGTDGFAERKQVLRELKEIARMLDRSAKR